jgi:hypothetical protein
LVLEYEQRARYFSMKSLTINCNITLKSNTGSPIVDFPSGESNITQDSFFDRYWDLTEAPDVYPGLTRGYINFPIDPSSYTKEEMKSLQSAFSFDVEITETDTAKTFTIAMTFYVGQAFIEELKNLCFQFATNDYADPEAIASTPAFKALFLRYCKK